MTGDLFFAGEGPCIWKALSAHFRKNGQLQKSAAARTIAELNEEYGRLFEKKFDLENSGMHNEARLLLPKKKALEQAIRENENIIRGERTLKERIELFEALLEVRYGGISKEDVKTAYHLR